LSVLLLALLPAAASERDQAIGSIAALRGEAIIKRPGEEQSRAASRGAEIRVGDVIRTGKTGACQVALNDESFLTLDNSTSIRVNQYSYGERENRRTAVVQVIEGMTRIVIFRLRGVGSRFRVETTTAAIDPDVLSDFLVDARPEKTDVVVLQKGLRVRNKSSLYVGEYRLGENQKTVVELKKAPISPVTILQAERERLLSFTRRF
jgi:ferric-dicitrate binding protein FerR (iron transport regulator)